MSILQKNRSGIFFISYLIIIAFLVLLQSGCEEEEECTIPRIDSVTFRDSLSRINYLVPGKIFTIHGENLDKPDAVYINHTSLNALYMLIYEKSITFLMPGVKSSFPEEEMSDSIRVIKSCGESLIRANILNAPPRISKMSNEYAIAGDILTLHGKYFSLLESVLFPGELEGEIIDGYNDTLCQVIVPDAVQDEGEIILFSKSGSGSTAYGIEYRGKTGLICNFDDLNTWEGYGGQVILSGSDAGIPSANDYFFLAEAENIPPGTEDIESTILPLSIDSTFTYPGNLTPNYFAIKMELFVKHPWSAGSYKIEIGKRNSPSDIEYVYEYYYKPWVDESDLVYSNPEWNTVSLPLSEFILKDSDDTYLQSYAQLRAINYMRWSFVNPSEEDGGVNISELGIAIDNIRIRQIVAVSE